MISFQLTYRALAPYVPGKPIQEVERELNMHPIKLASNENPLGPSPLAIAAAQKALADSNRYPDGSGFYVREALAKKHDVPAENIILGAGSTELIDLAARIMLTHDGCGVTSHGSFPLYYIAIRAAGARLLEIPLRNYAFDLDAIARNLPPDARIVYLANPNNPTGTMFTADELDSFLARVPETVLVIVDEAYFEYVERSDYSRSLAVAQRRGNVIVLRTFSKVYGLAGLRIGYGIGPADLLNEMNKLRGPFNTSGVAQAAALAALDDSEHVRKSVESNRAGLAQLATGLKSLAIQFVPSVANFMLVEFARDSEPISEELLRRGIIVRPMRWMGLPTAIRVSVGTREENQKFLDSLALVRDTTPRESQPSIRQFLGRRFPGHLMTQSTDELSDSTSSPANGNAPVAPGDPLTQILKTSRTIAVVGLSNRKFRPSYGVADYLKSVGYRIIPVNPLEKEVLGEKCYPRLEDIPEKVDIVDIFRRSEFVPEIVDAAIRVGARAIWMQEGVIDHEAAERARRAGLLVVMDTCILKEHVRRLRLTREPAGV